MSYNPIEYLKEGKVDFVFSLTPYDYKGLIIRIRQREDKLQIIHGFLNILKDKHPRFCFEIIYDMELFSSTTSYLLEKYIGWSFFSREMLRNFLTYTTIGKKYVLEHLDEIIENSKEKYEEILVYIFSDLESNFDFVEKLYLHKNLHTRYLFMKYLLLYCPEKITFVYDDITKYLTSYTHQEYEQMTFLPDLMDFKDISELAFLFLKHVNDKEMWEKLKEYILNTYEENNLAELLLDRFDIREFQKDSTRLFETSHSFKFQIYANYSAYICKSILDSYYEKIKYFKQEDHFDFAMMDVYSYGLGKKLENYVDKYLSISQNKQVEYLESGSTSSCYRFGDYVIKLVRSKWSYEDIICPNLYIILDNLEEDFVRGKDGVIKAGIEVQKYLKRSANNVPSEVLTFFKEELKRLGYYTTDSLIKGKCGDNCRLLDSYKDARVYDLESLPDIFKEYPMVLVDRDRVYELENRHPRQLRESFS